MKESPITPAAALSQLGKQFEARAIHVGERIDVRGIEPRLTARSPAVVALAPAGIAVLLRAGAIVVFGAAAGSAERLLDELGARIHGRYEKPEIEIAQVRLGNADGIDPDAITVRELGIDRLQVIAEILGKSVIVARNELQIAEAFNAIEPIALYMKAAPRRLPLKRRDMMRHIGDSMLVEQQLVGRAEVLEKPDLLWDRPELDRFYARLEDEYELRERHLVLETKLTTVSRTAQMMLELSSTKRSLFLEYSIVALIVVEIGLGLVELVNRHV